MCGRTERAGRRTERFVAVRFVTQLCIPNRMHLAWAPYGAQAAGAPTGTYFVGKRRATTGVSQRGVIAVGRRKVLVTSHHRQPIDHTGFRGHAVRRLPRYPASRVAACIVSGPVTVGNKHDLSRAGCVFAIPYLTNSRKRFPSFLFVR